MRSIIHRPREHAQAAWPIAAILIAYAIWMPSYPATFAQLSDFQTALSLFATPMIFWGIWRMAKVEMAYQDDESHQEANT